MTPESSEQPRETRDGMPLVERFDGLAAIQSQGLNDKTVGELQRVAGKVSSPELASLAAEWLSADMKTLDKALAFDREGVLVEIKRLAASVLAQAEGTPRK